MHYVTVTLNIARLVFYRIEWGKSQVDLIFLMSTVSLFPGLSANLLKTTGLAAVLLIMNGAPAGQGFCSYCEVSGHVARECHVSRLMLRFHLQKLSSLLIAWDVNQEGALNSVFYAEK